MGKAFIICGPPAAGKSTYGVALARAHQAALLDIDTCTEPIIQSALRGIGRDPNDRDSNFFKETFRESIYETLLNIARQNLPWTNVVVVGPFTREIKQSDWPEKLKEILGSEPEIHYVTANINDIKKRMEVRNNPRDTSKLINWDDYLKYFGGADKPEFEHVFVDTSLSPIFPPG